MLFLWVEPFDYALDLIFPANHARGWKSGSVTRMVKLSWWSGYP